MAKNKPNSKFTINDAMALGQQEQKTEKSFNDSVNTDIGYTKEFNEQLKNYNENIMNINEMYKKLEPRFRVLVRCYTKELQQDENGLVIPNTIAIPIPTNNGVGDIGFVESPWPFSNKVIVIAAPEDSSLETGDVCMLENSPVIGVAGKGRNAMLKVPNSFVHPDEKEKYLGGVPIDPTDFNYGYLLVNDYDLIIKSL